MQEKEIKYKSQTEVPQRIWDKLDVDYLKNGLKPKKLAEKYKIDVNVIYRYINAKKRPKKKEKLQNKKEEIQEKKIIEEWGEESSEYTKTAKRAHQKARYLLEKCESAKDLRSITGSIKDVFGINQTMDGKPADIGQQTLLVDLSPEFKEMYASWRKELES